LALIMAVVAISHGQTSRQLQKKVQLQQAEISRGATNKQLAERLLSEMAQISLKNDRIKQVLAANGFTVNANASTPATSNTTQNR
jgi:hypothetical protein